MNKVKAYRGRYVDVDEAVSIINELLADAVIRKKAIVIIGNPEADKLDGAMLSLQSLKELLYSIERFGDLIPQPDPLKGEPNVPMAIQNPASDPISRKFIGEDSGYKPI